MAFTSDRAGQAQIYLMDADGSRQRPLLSVPSGQDDIQPAWSPDGTRIALSRGVGYQSANFGSSQIVVINVATGTTVFSYGPPGTLNFRPAWSPDGTHIAFAHAGPSQSPVDIWVMAADGTNSHPITAMGTATYPAWSPDGRRLVFSASPPGVSQSQIFETTAEGTHITQLTDNGLNYTPSWAPAAQIVFTRSINGGGKQLWIMNSDGTGQSALTNDGGEDKFPSWSPDATRVVYSHGASPCQNPGACTAADGYQIWALRLTDLRTVQLTHTLVPELQFGESYPTWAKLRAK